MIALICPLCRQPLQPDGNVWRCGAAHAFDRAREGYLNLLPVQHKKSRAPGDSAEMLRARRAFLEAGHYAPLRDSLLDLLRPLHARSLLDIGCGEGWYTAAFADALATDADLAGIDIAKDAVRLAARKYPGIAWLVGSSAALPVADASLDIVSAISAPLPPVAEIVRVLRPGGHLLMAVPAEGHLQSLRAALFDEVRPHRPEKFPERLAPAFARVTQRTTGFPLHLDTASLQDLLLMTPYAWRARPEKRTALVARATATPWETRAEFGVFLLRKVAPD